MKNVITTSVAALLASTVMASAGGIERTSQSVDIIFEEGTYVEFSLSYAMPSVSGFDSTPVPLDTGIMSPNYFGFAGGFKTDISDRFAIAAIFDQPFGSLAEYTASAYTDMTADLSSSAITVIGSYDVTDRIVIFGGGTYQSMSATAAVPLAGDYTIDAEAASGFGYVLGAAYQIPEYALRVSLTYRSTVATTHDIVENSVLIPLDTASTMDVVTPQSVNLEFQTGINEKTLIFGSVRWVDWSEFDLTPNNYLGVSLVDYDDDRITYNLGVGRKLSDALSAAVTVGYEANLGGDPTPLAPTDGFFSVGAGLTYTVGTTKISGGAKYIWLGDSSGPAGTWEDNSALGFGLNFSFQM